MHFVTRQHLTALRALKDRLVVWDAEATPMHCRAIRLAQTERLHSYNLEPRTVCLLNCSIVPSIHITSVRPSQAQVHCAIMQGQVPKVVSFQATSPGAVRNLHLTRVPRPDRLGSEASHHIPAMLRPFTSRVFSRSDTCDTGNSALYLATVRATPTTCGFL